MTNEEILKKAVEKAIEGGWKPQSTDIVDEVIKIHKSLGFYFHIIFSHDFAKAFWG